MGSSIDVSLGFLVVGFIRRTQVISEFGKFYKKWGDCGGVLDSWMIAQLIPLKRFRSECKICYKNGVQSFSFFYTNPYH